MTDSKEPGDQPLYLGGNHKHVWVHMDGMLTVCDGFNPPEPASLFERCHCGRIRRRPVGFVEDGS